MNFDECNAELDKLNLIVKNTKKAIFDKSEVDYCFENIKLLSSYLKLLGYTKFDIVYLEKQSEVEVFADCGNISSKFSIDIDMAYKTVWRTYYKGNLISEVSININEFICCWKLNLD